MRLKIQLMMALALCLTAGSCGKVHQEAKIERARAACMELGQTLKGRLQTAVGNGDFVGAIRICQSEAPAVSAEVSATYDLSIRRTSRKARNQNNVPHARERKGLEIMERRIESGEPPESVEFMEWVKGEGGKTELFYMKPIITGPLCLTCHGKQIDTVLRQEIRTRYPGDQATGYDLNQLRGAFSVRVSAR